jgi:hydroxyacylglutathione hydrolase
MSIKPITVGELGTNCYLVIDDDSGDALVVDPGAEPERIYSAIRKSGLKVKCIINTHGHGDHIGGNARIKKECGGIPIGIHRLDAGMLQDPGKNLSAAAYSRDILSPCADLLFEDGDAVSAGEGIRLRVMHTPGHTQGSICLVCAEEYIITGDTLFRESVGRCDLPGGDEKLLSLSLDRLMKLPKSMLVYPGHGPGSTIGYEAGNNPFLTG